MCTAVSMLSGDHYFGRNLDYEHSFGEKVIITPRNYSVKFKKKNSLLNHFAILGMGIIEDDFPLYFDAVNEKGLCFAGLNFPGNADYKSFSENSDNITPYELPLWILGQCGNVNEAKKMLNNINLLNISFSDELKLSPLHFIFSDKNESVTIESVKEGLFVYDNPAGVLTNNPAFPLQMFNLNNYMGLSNDFPENKFSKKLDLKPYSRGMGAIGLPGDLSSQSRFVKAVFTKMNSVSGKSEEEAVSQFFHILYSVYQQKGCVHMGNGMYEITNYSSCINASKGIYYYTTYNNSRITGIDMYKENLENNQLISYSLLTKQDIFNQN